MQNHCFKFLFFFFCILFLNTKFPLSESERPSLDFNGKQKTIVSNALSNCGDYNFDDLLNTRKKELGISEPDKSINKKKQLDNSLGIEVSRSIETIYTPEQSLANVKKILSSINDERLYPAVAYYIIKDFAFYEHGLCKSLRNHLKTYNIYKEFYFKTKTIPVVTKIIEDLEFLASRDDTKLLKKTIKKLRHHPIIPGLNKLKFVL